MKRLLQFLPLAGALLIPALGFCQQSNKVQLTKVMDTEILFDFGKYEVDDANKEKLEILFDYAASLDLFLIEITGHTDSIGNLSNNYKLSQKRGKAVKSYLLSLGLNEELVHLQVFGEKAPIADNTSEKGRQRNRRSEVILYEVITVQEADATDTIIPVVDPLLVFEEPAPDEVQTPKGITEKPQDSTQNPPQVEETIQNQTVKQAVIEETEQKEEEPLQKVELKQAVEEKPEQIVEEPIIVVEEIILEDNFVEDEVQEAPAIDPELSPIEQKVNIESIGESFDLENLYFIGDMEVLLEESKSELDKLYRFMQLNPNVRIEIGGHINYQGRLDPYSLDYRLAEFRARTIYDYLIQKGVEHWRLAYKGYGNSFMRYPEPRTEQEAEQNRRVEIKITGFGKPN